MLMLKMSLNCFDDFVQAIIDSIGLKVYIYLIDLRDFEHTQIVSGHEIQVVQPGRKQQQVDFVLTAASNKLMRLHKIKLHRYIRIRTNPIGITS